MTHSPLEEHQKNYRQREKQILEDYFTFLRFPSISSEQSSEKEVRACADWLISRLKKLNFQTELWQTSGHPVIYAEHLEAGSGAPTLLIYNHYDVQPVDPLEAWTSPPFTPTVREGQVYARGAQDNKGQCTYVIEGLKLLLERDHRFPINVKLCIEGEEECGSSGLAGILEQKKEKLKADYLAIVDLGMRGKDLPAVTLGIRGLITMDVEVEGSTTDLHSGCHGGLAFNPLHALVAILSKLRHSDGRIAVPGFYDKVKPASKEEMESLDLHFDEEAYFNMFGIKPTGGETKLSALERNWLQPTLEINGISGGYSGTGFKTVIPAKASAKVSCRLVPFQDPDEIGALTAHFIASLAPAGVSVKVHIHPGKGAALRTRPTSPISRCFAQALTEVFETPCTFILEGASIPIVGSLAKACGAEVALLGLALADDCIHAPNEHFGIDRLEKGALTIARALELLSKETKKESHP